VTPASVGAPKPAAVRASASINALEMVRKERQRQAESEGYTPEHDDLHDEGQLAAAAAGYAAGVDLVYDGDASGPVWPFEGNVEDAVEGKSRLRQLIIAGALVVAEIERRLRAGERP